MPPTSLPYQRESLSLALGAAAIASAVLLYFVSDSGSTRRLFRGVWLRFFVLWSLRIGKSAPEANPRPP